MKTVRKALLVLVSCLLLNTTFSQNALRIQLASGSVIPATADTGTTFSFNVWIINDSATTYNGQIDFGYRIDTATFSNSNTASGFEYTVSQDSISPFDTLTKGMIAHVAEPAFKAGPSVVVIWPIATAATAIDSLVFNILIGHPSGIGETDNERLRLFVIGNLLCIDKSAEVQLKQVRIFDVTGRKILEEQTPTNTILLPPTDAGIYIAEIIFNNNQRKTFRFYR